MLLQWRGGIRRRVLVLSGLSLLTGFYLSLLFFSQLALFKKLPVAARNDFQKEDKSQEIEYTLPSLDDVIKSEVDLDLQRVLSAFRSQHEQILTVGTPLKVIIASTWRSGSTFVGEIISSYPGAFYHYEPLMSYGINQISLQQTEGKVLDLLKGLLKCDYSNQTEYLNYAYGDQDILVRNKRLWSLCSTMPRFKCYVPENIGKLCSLFPIHVMKLVRVRLEGLAPLLEDRHTKIIWLTRDPRAIINSRLSSVEWCTSSICKKPKYLCNDLTKDFNSFNDLIKKYSNKVMILRYEDLAKSPYTKTDDIFQFLGLPMHHDVTDYLKNHLNGDSKTPWSTIHDPEKQSKKWIKSASWNSIVNIQYYCRPVMKLLGYRPFDTQKDLVAENSLQALSSIQR